MSLCPVIDMGENSPIVIDNGSGFVKAGFSCTDRPSIVIPTMVGRPQDRVKEEEEAPRKRQDKAEKEYFIGDEAKLKRGTLAVSYPIEKRLIGSWDDMIRIWHHIFVDRLHTRPENHPVLMTESCRNPPNEREKLCEILFETYLIPEIYIQAQEVLSVYTSGKTTGLVIDCGEVMTTAVPVYEGYKISSSILSLELAGKTLTDYLSRLMAEKDLATPNPSPGAQENPPFGSVQDRECIREAKEKLCFVALDFEQEMTNMSTVRSMESSFSLPDGHQLTVGSQRFQCPEGLFQPLLLDIDVNGIHEMSYNSIMRSDTDIRKDLYGNVVMAGGSTMFAGMSDRMGKELMALAPTAMKIKIVAPPERKFAAWLGGSIFAALSTFEKVWITREEYDEHGPSIVQKKCF